MDIIAVRPWKPKKFTIKFPSIRKTFNSCWPVLAHTFQKPVQHEKRETFRYDRICRAGSWGRIFFKCLLSVMWVSRSSGLMRWACFTRLLANTEHEWCFGQWKHRPEAHRNVSVVPDVRILEREERRSPRQCNWQKGELYYWLRPGPYAASSAVVQVREPRAQAVTQIYRVSTCSWFKRIGYKFAKQFHWSKLLCWWDFSGGFRPIPNFLIGKQQ